MKRAILLVVAAAGLLAATGCTSTHTAIVSSEKKAFVVKMSPFGSNAYSCTAESGKPVCTQVTESELGRTNMKKIFAGLAILGTLATLNGCSFVTSAQPGATSATGEAWYVKSTYFLVFNLSNSVYYCPKEAPTKCVKAQLD